MNNNGTSYGIGIIAKSNLRRERERHFVWSDLLNKMAHAFSPLAMKKTLFIQTTCDLTSTTILFSALNPETFYFNYKVSGLA